MKPFEYVLVIISVIIGLSLTEFAFGISYMIQNFRTAVYYAPYFAGLIFNFLVILHYWITLYSSREKNHWTVPQIGIVFIQALCYYVLTQIAVPDPTNFNQNYKEYFDTNAAALYAVGVLVCISLLAESCILRRTRPLKWYIITGILFTLTLSGLLVDNTTFRGLLMMVIILPAQIYNMYVMKVVVKE